MTTKTISNVVRRRVLRFDAALSISATFVLFACGADGEESVETTAARADAETQLRQESFYDLGHLVQIEVELDPNDWAELRQQGRGLVSTFAGQQIDYEYAYFDADVTVDGERYENVAVRKKGFIGSLSADRPSIKVHFERNQPGQTHLGLKRLTLNNDRQDPSHSHQCLAYGLFERAGLPASRCNLAHVIVNGEDLGTYSNVEPVKKPMLARHFSSDDGNLYEGQIADFTANQIETFQLKTNEAENDRSDLRRLASALDGDDEGLVSRLGEAVDLEAYRTFWALETLVGHWDGYAGNRNNYYVYGDPATDRLVFLPWGTDSAFEVANPFDPVNVSVSAYATSRLANRLYSLPEERELYRNRQAELLDEVWNDSELLEELEQIESLAPDASPAALAAQRSLIEDHPAAVRAELSAEAPEWIDLGGGPPDACSGPPTTITGRFVTSWDSLGASPGAGEFELDAELDGAKVEAQWFGGAGVDPALGDGIPRIRFTSLLDEQRILIVDVQLTERTFVPGTTPLHGLETVGFVSLIDAGAFRLGGFVGDGQIELDEAGRVTGEPVSGRFTGQLLQLGCLGL